MGETASGSFATDPRAKQSTRVGCDRSQGQGNGTSTALYKEASALRVLAGRIQMQPIRDKLLDLAARCETLAKSMVGSQQAADLRQEDLPADLH